MRTTLFNFSDGDCAVFAVALSRLTGLPIRALVEFCEEVETTVLIHAYVWAGPAPYPAIDATGPTSVQDILRRYPHGGSAEEIQMTEDEVMALNYGEPSNWPDWRDALPAAQEVADVIRAEGQRSP